MASFKLGDLVRLKTGGPVMIVAGIPQKNSYLCSWSVMGKPSSVTYPAEVLTNEQAHIVPRPIRFTF